MQLSFRLLVQPFRRLCQFHFSDQIQNQALLDELGRANSLLQIITESAEAPIFAKDLEGRLIFANEETLKVLGRSREEVLGKSDWEWSLDPTFTKTVRENDEKVSRSGIALTFEEEFKTSQGDACFSLPNPCFEIQEDGSLVLWGLQEISPIEKNMSRNWQRRPLNWSRLYSLKRK